MPRRCVPAGIIPALAGNTTTKQATTFRTTDHPRSRGEYLQEPGHLPGKQGSSPLSRGIPPRPCSSLGGPRIIPALAGNTGKDPGYNGNTRDHPRSRGEYVDQGCGSGPHGGSSPLSRGIPWRYHGRIDSEGIIPALAGNTGLFPGARFNRADHPRSRGEYTLLSHCTTASQGSSPLSRGIPHLLLGSYRQVGIIPALAGNTRGSTSGRRIPMDHPRSRGEYHWGFIGVMCLTGSSPLSRGILGQPGGVVRRFGIIPALAGNTRTSWCCCRWRTDHPRSRGEYSPASSTVTEPRGSSPLSRGILTAEQRAVAAVRIIPALAGNTSAQTPRAPTHTDHPRSRGEYSPASSTVTEPRGSSPLSRGIRRWRRAAGWRARIIPALAGNTRSQRESLVNSPDHPRSRGEYTC